MITFKVSEYKMVKNRERYFNIVVKELCYGFCVIGETVGEIKNGVNKKTPAGFSI